VQAVMIALPNHLHSEAIEAAAATGKHLFFEPPLGLTATEIRRALHALSFRGGVAQADMELRCLPVMDLVREQLQAETIGKPLMAKARLGCDWGYGGGEWVPEVESQGVFLWLGCWYLDLLDWVYKAAPTTASVVGGYAMNGRVMDYGCATLAFPDQRVGSFEFNLLAMEGTQITLWVAGTEGELEADLLSGGCRWRGRKQPWQEIRRPCSEPVHGFAGMRESISGFVTAVLHARRPRADVEACRRVHETALACTEAERQRKTVPIEPLEES